MKEKELILPYKSPFTLMRRLSDEIERMFDDVGVRRPFGFFTPEVHTYEWTPVIELFQKENKLFVRVELPGLKKEEVKIEVTNELLTIEGERKVEKEINEKEIKEKELFRSERFYGTFYRQIPLPEGVKSENAKAIFKDGILEIELPIEVKKPVVGRRLPIEEPKEKEKKELVGV